MLNKKWLHLLKETVELNSLFKIELLACNK